MTKLRFPAEDVRKLLEHSKTAGGRKLTISERLHIYGDPKGWEAQPDEEKHGKPGLWLVKDEGIYLMSNGSPGLMATGSNGSGTANVVVYAEGFDPTRQDPAEVWDAAQAAVGGDDFVELIPADLVDAGLPDGAKTFVLKIGSSSIMVLTEKGRKS